jgi:hypothetical protein
MQYYRVLLPALLLVFLSSAVLSQPADSWDDEEGNGAITVEGEGSQTGDSEGDSGLSFIEQMPTGLQWTWYIGWIVVVSLAFWLFYRGYVSKHVRKGGHPANIRSMLGLLWTLVFALWTWYYFFLLNPLFGYLMLIPILIISVLCVVLALTGRKASEVTNG